MQAITLVTGNAGKLREWQRLAAGALELDSADVDLDEIQTLDMEELIADKARRAYQAIKKPIIVEDVAVGISSLNGLPGPFIKFFEKQLGPDALFQLAKDENDPVTVHCAVAYFDGQELLTAHAEVDGKAVSLRGQNGFGFDGCFMLDGQTKTYGEMAPAEKDAVSHRAKAVKLLMDKLSSVS